MPASNQTTTTLSPPDTILSMSEDASVSRLPDGSLNVAATTPVDVKLLSRIRSIGVEHLCDIEEHTIHRVFNSVSHYLRFVDGAEARLAYNMDGQLLELSADGLVTRIDQGEDIVFSMKKAG